MPARKNATLRSQPEQLFRELATTLEFDRLFLKAAQAAALAGGADCAGLVLRHGEQLRYQFFFGLSAAEAVRLGQFRFPCDRGIVGEMLACGAPVYTADYRRHPAAIPEFIELGVRSSLAVPIPVAGRLEGALVVAWRTRPRRPPGRRTLLLIEAIAAFMGNACYRSALEAALARDAHHDALTGLPNRGVLMDRLAHARRRALRGDRLLVVALIDIDGFKQINDAFGHEAGDRLLATIADRLGETLRTTDTVSRYGGDEFVILMEDVAHLEQIEGVLDRILLKGREPLVIDGHSMAVTLSAGITIYPFDDHSAEILLQHADQAMYEAKRNGGNQYRCFERTNTARLALRSQLRRDVEVAVLEERWQASFQPIVDCEGVTVGLEACLRWPKAYGSVVREEDIADLTEGLLRTRLLERLLNLIEADGDIFRESGVPLHINLHSPDLHDVQLPERLRQWRDEVLGVHGIMVIEIAEDAMLANAAAGTQFAAHLKERGFRVLLDHFHGHKRAGFAYVADQAFYAVKCALSGDAAELRLLQALSAGAGALGLQLYAGGVDSTAQREIAEGLGCRYAQGLLVAPELPARAARHWLKTALHQS